MPEHDLNRFQSPPDLSTIVSPVVDPRAVRLALALMAAPAVGYAGYKAYQHFHPQVEGAAEDAKTAMLQRYGIEKAALSPLTRNMLIGAGVGGLAGGGLNYAFHHDKPDALERAGRASIGGAVMGGLAGGVLTRSDRSSPAPGPRMQEVLEATSQPRKGPDIGLPPAAPSDALPDILASARARTNEARDRIEQLTREDATGKALARVKELIHAHANRNVPANLHGGPLPPDHQKIRESLEEFDRRMLDPNYTFRF